MKTKLILISLFCFFAIKSTFAQDKSIDFNFSTIQFGIGPYNFSGSLLQNNENFADDGIFIGPNKYYGFESGTSFFLSYQKYGAKKSIWAYQISYTNLPGKQQLANTTFEEAILPIDVLLDFSNIEDVGSLNHTNIGLSVGHLWRLLTGSQKRMVINLGPTIGSNFSNQNYYFFDQNTEVVSSTDKKIVDLSLKVAFEMNWRFYSNFGIGVQYDIPFLQKHFVTTNEFNLNKDNPLHKDYFARPYDKGVARVKLTYFIDGSLKQ